MITREDDGIWIELRETIACHPDEVFDCLTTPEGLTRWFPVNARVDLRSGGCITFGWDRDFKSTTTIAILDYNSGGRIVWDWQVAHADVHAPVYWTIEPSVEEGCRVVLRQGPFRDDVDSLLHMAREVEDWRWQLCNLRSSLEVKHDMRQLKPL